jgi:hypothetical protein
MESHWGRTSWELGSFARWSSAGLPPGVRRCVVVRCARWGGVEAGSRGGMREARRASESTSVEAPLLTVAIRESIPGTCPAGLCYRGLALPSAWRATTRWRGRSRVPLLSCCVSSKECIT